MAAHMLDVLSLYQKNELFPIFARNLEGSIEYFPMKCSNARLQSLHIDSREFASFISLISTFFESINKLEKMG